MNIDTQISKPIQEEVWRRLREIEQKHKVNIIFAIESGSRAWGFPSPDSDYDVRFVYVHDIDYYLQISDSKIFPVRDVIENPIVDDIDCSGWELRKSLGLIHKGNPVIFEWMNSPLMYRPWVYWTHDLKEIANRYYDPKQVFAHYYSMMRGQYARHIYGKDQVLYKKYLYVLRPLLAAMWVNKYRDTRQVPMLFSELLADAQLPEKFQVAIDRLLSEKKHVSEKDTREPDLVLNELIEGTLENYLNLKLPEQEIRSLYDLNSYFRYVVKSREVMKDREIIS